MTKGDDMLARWDLKTTAAGLSVRYENLQDHRSLECGLADDMSPAELLVFMVEHGGVSEGASEVVMKDGAFAYMLLPPATEKLRVKQFLTNIFELQG